MFLSDLEKNKLENIFLMIIKKEKSSKIVQFWGPYFPIMTSFSIWSRG